MERISDTVSSVFRIVIKDKRPVACSSGDSAIVWSDTFGLGWRFGISFNPHEWFAKVRLYLDHNHSHSEQDQAVVTICLKDAIDKDAKGFKEKVTMITDFGHGQPVLLGSWSPDDLALHSLVSLTLTTKTRIPQNATDPLSSMALALRQSMETGDFVDTKFHVFSARRPGTTVGNPRVLYVNSNSIGLLLPKPTSDAKRVNGLAPPFLVNMTDDQHISGDSVLHEYEYEQDSDLDDDEESDVGSDGTIAPQSVFVPPKLRTGSSPGSRRANKPRLVPTSQISSRSGSTQGNVDSDMWDGLPAEPPAYSVNNYRMVLVKGVAYRTWATYIYFRYTGQVSFLPLKSAQGSASERIERPSRPCSCSPKSMYRIATALGDERLKELAFRAIKEGLTKDNIVEEAFSWFTAQYPDIIEHEVDQVSELRKSPEVSLALKRQVKAMSLGEKPWAENVLIAIMDKLNPSEPTA